MIANMTRGGGARGVLNYVFGPGRLGVTGRAELVGGTMAGWDARVLVASVRDLGRRWRPGRGTRLTTPSYPGRPRPSRVAA